MASKEPVGLLGCWAVGCWAVGRKSSRCLKKIMVNNSQQKKIC